MKKNGDLTWTMGVTRIRESSLHNAANYATKIFFSLEKNAEIMLKKIKKVVKLSKMRDKNK